MKELEAFQREVTLLSDETLIEMVQERDLGFDLDVFINQLDMVNRLKP